VSNDTPIPPEEAHGFNPPAGAVIDYYLRSVPADSVTLEIRDARGALVNRFSSNDRLSPPSEPPQIADEFLPRANPPTRRAGLNRFVWDLRYPPPPAESRNYSIAVVAGEGTVAEPQGPLVVPGEYLVRLSVGGQTYKQRLRVELDPRVRVPDSVFAGQLRLALEISNSMAQQQALRLGLRGFRGELRVVGQRAIDKGARGRLVALERVADSLAHEARTVGGELAGLESVVESADRAPTEQAREVFAGLRDRLGAVSGRWQRALASDLPALNAELRRQGVPSLQAPAQARDSIAGP
jgi:hypothetical protein